MGAQSMDGGYGRGVKRWGLGLCESDSWAPPVSLLRAASRDQTANQRPHKLSLSFVWSLRLVSGLAIGWILSCRLFPVVVCLVPTRQLTLPRVSSHSSHSSSSSVINLLNHDSPRSVRIYYRRPFLFNDQSRVPVHLIISLRRPCRVLTRRTINTSLLPPHTQLLFVLSSCLEKVPGSWIEVLTTLAFCRPSSLIRSL
jgi:hypothetical protein